MPPARWLTAMDYLDVQISIDGLGPHPRALLLEPSFFSLWRSLTFFFSDLASRGGGDSKRA